MGDVELILMITKKYIFISVGEVECIIFYIWMVRTRSQL